MNIIHLYGVKSSQILSIRPLKSTSHMKPAGSSPRCWKKKFLTRHVGIALYDPFPAEGFERLLSCLPDGNDDADGVYRILAGDNFACSLVDTDGDSHFCRSLGILGTPYLIMGKSLNICS